MCGLLILALLALGGGTTEGVSGSDYSDLVSLFNEFREFVKPSMLNDVPDYSAVRMAKQKRALKNFKDRLSDIDRSGWSVSQQVEYHPSPCGNEWTR